MEDLSHMRNAHWRKERKKKMPKAVARLAQTGDSRLHLEIKMNMKWCEQIHRPFDGMFHNIWWSFSMDKSTVPFGSGGGSCSLSHSEIFLIPKLHKILLRSVEFMSMSCIVKVSIFAFSPAPSSEISHMSGIRHAVRNQNTPEDGRCQSGIFPLSRFLKKEK